MKTNNDPYTLLANLGVSFDRELDISLSPEECFISLIEDHNIIENRRLLSLAILAFENIQDSLRPDLFKRLSEGMTPRGRAVLGGIIFRGHLSSHGRWNGLFKLLQKSREGEVIIGNEDLIVARGTDKFFEGFGIRITPVAESGKKKLLEREWLFSHNPWIKNRIFMGPSTRADIYTVKTNFLESTAYRFMERFNYTPSSLYGIWNEMEFAQSLGAY
ncbi:MAG: hypothetical protein KC493_13595 [Bacteriovoracaceae bacterium]|nr:hypothetical protein [Bacteriovoracaceae bacterium]